MKKVLSVTLALVLCVLSLLTVDVQTHAAVSYIDTISEGQTWSKSWYSSTEYQTLRLDVAETNFYRITVNDYKQSGRVLIYVYNATYEETVGYIERQGGSTYVSNDMLLYADCAYELTCYYLYNYSDSTIDASMSITFNKNTAAKPVIPNCSLSSSNLQAQLDDGEHLWLQFTTTTAGDYTLNFSDLHAYIGIYTADFQLVDYVDSEYWSDYYDAWYSKDGAIFKLAAYSKYYIEINTYEYSSTLLSMTKNYRDVQKIEIDGVYGQLTSFSEIDSDWFTFKVTYTDGHTVSGVDVEAITSVGYDNPYVEYAGESVDIQGRIYNRPGTQPVNCSYNGYTTTYYVHIESLVDWVDNLNPVGEGDYCEITYESDEEQSYWWHVNVAESGVYSVKTQNSDSFATNFESYAISIVDSNNNPIPYDSNIIGWPLVAGIDYALNVIYTYDDGYTWNDVEFWLDKEDTVQNGWAQSHGNWIYYENGVLATYWKYIGSSWYYFGETGVMQTGWQLINNNWYYFGDSGNMLTGWQYLGSSWYYFNAGGTMYTGWMQSGSIWYYFTDSGNLATGWQYIGTSWYYFNESGVMQTGWQYIGYNWYYFTGSGNMLTGWQYLGSSWYYFTDSGNMVTGWQLINNNWYYFHSGGNMATGWLNLGGDVWYYLADGGNMLTGLQVLGGNEYYFNASGVWVPSMTR